VIHSKVFSILVATAAVALGAFMAGCALEAPASGSGEASDVSSQTSDLQVGAAPIKQLDSVGASTQAQVNVVAPSALHLAPVVQEDHLLGNGGTDEGPRPHPWAPAPEDGTGGTGSGSSDPTTNNGTSDNKSSK